MLRLLLLLVFFSCKFSSIINQKNTAHYLGTITIDRSETKTHHVALFWREKTLLPKYVICNSLRSSTYSPTQFSYFGLTEIPLQLHSVDISGFFCHSDFTWNQFWLVWTPKKLPFWPFWQLCIFEMFDVTYKRKRTDLSISCFRLANKFKLQNCMV